MLSRVKNYLEDQLLGFSVVPLLDVLLANGKLVKEFPLSSTDLFHSPAGFVQLSVSYVRNFPDVVVVPRTVISEEKLADGENEDSIPCEYEKIEFPDPNVVNENQIMVSEYFAFQPINVETQGSASMTTSDNGNCLDDERKDDIIESSATANSIDSAGALKIDTTVSCYSTTESAVVFQAASQYCADLLSAAESESSKDKSPEFTEGEEDSSARTENEFIKPIININIEPEQTVVQQEIVDMYMKSLQQFTDSLAKIKLPLDVESNNTTTDNRSSNSEKKLQTPKGNGPRVFYGSRAFF